MCVCVCFASAAYTFSAQPFAQWSQSKTGLSTFLVFPVINLPFFLIVFVHSFRMKVDKLDTSVNRSYAHSSVILQTLERPPDQAILANITYTTTSSQWVWYNKNITITPGSTIRGARVIMKSGLDGGATSGAKALFDNFCLRLFIYTNGEAPNTNTHAHTHIADTSTVQSLPKVKSLPHFFCMIQWVDCSNFSQIERLCTKILYSFCRTKKFGLQRLKELL